MLLMSDTTQCLVLNLVFNVNVKYMDRVCTYMTICTKSLCINLKKIIYEMFFLLATGTGVRFGKDMLESIVIPKFLSSRF